MAINGAYICDIKSEQTVDGARCSNCNRKPQRHHRTYKQH